MVREAQEEKAGGGSFKRVVSGLLEKEKITQQCLLLRYRKEAKNGEGFWFGSPISPHLHPYPILKEKTPGAQFLKNSTIVDRLGIQNQQALERFREKNFENSKNKFKAEVVGLLAF